MTLVEVTASLALLGALLGSAVLAKRQINEQRRAAERRLEAAAALDHQLSRWQAQSNELADDENQGQGDIWPRTGAGAALEDRWWWRAEVLGPDPTPDAPLQVVRYTAYDPTLPGGPAEATIDVLVAHPSPNSDLATATDRAVLESNNTVPTPGTTP